MICPKCSREMGNDAATCTYCGFTFQTPRNPDPTHTAPFAATPFTAPAPTQPTYTPAEPFAEPGAPAAPITPGVQEGRVLPPFSPRPAQPVTPPYQPAPQSAAPQTPVYPAYSAPPYQPAMVAQIERERNAPLTVWQYFWMFIVNAIPVAGLIVMIVWAASRNVNVNRRRFAGAALILRAIGYLFVLGAFLVYLAYYTPLYLYFFR